MEIDKEDALTLLKGARQSCRNGYTDWETCACCDGLRQRRAMYTYMIKHVPGCLTVKLYNYVHGTKYRKYLPAE